MAMLYVLMVLVLGYLLGSIPSSIWIGKLLYGIDVRQHGSGNAGATNTFRVLGWKAGLLTLVMDVGKGFVASGVVAPYAATALPSQVGPFATLTLLQLLAAVAAVAGHMFPLFAGFRGGKGVATAAGALLAIAPLSLLISVGVFLLVLLTTRYVSLASITAALSFPLVVALQRFLWHQPVDLSLLLFTTLLALAIVWAHRSNIRRLLRREEPRIRLGFKLSGT